VFYPGTL